MDLSCAQKTLQSRSAASRCACNSLAVPPVVSVRSASSVTGQPSPTAARCLHAPLRPRRCRRRGIAYAQADDLEVPQDNKTCGLIAASIHRPYLHSASACHAVAWNTVYVFPAGSPMLPDVVSRSGRRSNITTVPHGFRTKGIYCYRLAGF